MLQRPRAFRPTNRPTVTGVATRTVPAKRSKLQGWRYACLKYYLHKAARRMRASIAQV